LADVTNAGKDLKILAKFLEVNITGTRKILKQLEKRTQHIATYSLKSQYIDSRM
jgi:hypothetical protein